VWRKPLAGMPPKAVLLSDDAVDVAAGSSRPPSREQIGWRERVVYGLGGIPQVFGEVGLKGLAVPVFQMTLKVDPALLGLLLALPRLWDAITDPVMGYISDRTTSRFGRRRPYIVLGALLTGLAFMLVWLVPVHWSQPAQLAWFLVTVLWFYTCLTIWGVPYQSLGYEMSPDYNERTAIMGVRTFFQKVGDFACQWMFPLAHLAVFGSVMMGVRVIAVVIGVVVFMLAGSVPGLLLRERSSAAPARRSGPLVRSGFWRECKGAWDNRAMRILAVLVLLQVIPGLFSSNLDYYLLVYHVSGGDIAQGAVWKGLLSSSYAIVGLLAIWPIAWASRRFDKRTALIGVYGMVAIGGIMKWFVFSPQHPWLCLLDPLLCAPIFVANGMIGPSMVADICDQDELATGERRAGMFGAFLSWVQKAAISAAFFGSGVALNLVGFNANLLGAQNPGTILRIRLILVLVTSVSAILAAGVLLAYPLNRASAEAVRAALERRRENGATDASII